MVNSKIINNLNKLQIHYTVTNTTPATLRLVVDNIHQSPTKLDLSTGDKVIFPIEVPSGYNVRVSKPKAIKTLDNKGNKKKILIKRFILIPD